MRIAYLFLLVPAIGSSGCAGLIARSGLDPTQLQTAEDVHGKFGKPYASGSANDALKEDQSVPRNAAFYEDYMVRQKIATSNYGEGYVMLLLITFGTAEFLALPPELFLLAKRSILGQKLRFTYDIEGRLIRLQLDGDEQQFWMFNCLHYAPRVPVQDSPHP